MRSFTHASSSNLPGSGGVGDVDDRDGICASTTISHIGIAARDKDAGRTCTNASGGDLRNNRIRINKIGNISSKRRCLREITGALYG